MTNLIMIVPIIASFLITLLLLPSWIKRARRAGLEGEDMNKTGNVKVAESGGVTVVAGFALGTLFYIAINTFFFKTTENHVEIFALMSSVLLISFIAFTDDILGWKIGLRRRTRLILVAFAAIPLMAINAGKSLVGLPLFGIIDLGIIYPLILIPLGIVGATTTYNFLAGFNGLEAGQGIIILSSLSLMAFLTGNTWLSIIGLCMVASLIAFLTFNFFPAEVLPGDSMTYATGGLIAIMSILGDFERIAVFFFIPYILETGLKLRGKLRKQSFGKADEEGSLELRYEKIYSLTHLSIFLMKKLLIKPSEKKVVISLWIFQIIIIALGFILLRGGIK